MNIDSSLPETLPAVQQALAEAGVDGWLLYDFRGMNPIAAGMMRLEGMTSRRAFAFVPTRGTPVALTHAIEQAPWRHWPAEWTQRDLFVVAEPREHARASTSRESGSRWNTRRATRCRISTAFPAGVIDMVRATGATVASSGELVSRFYAMWNADHIATHVRAAEEIAAIAQRGARARR